MQPPVHNILNQENRCTSLKSPNLYSTIPKVWVDHVKACLYGMTLHVYQITACIAFLSDARLFPSIVGHASNYFGCVCQYISIKEKKQLKKSMYKHCTR